MPEGRAIRAPRSRILVAGCSCIWFPGGARRPDLGDLYAPDPAYAAETVATAGRRKA